MSLGFTYRETTDSFICDNCGDEVKRGIINISGHWANCAGKEQMDFVHKVGQLPLDTKDKLDIIKNGFSIHQ